MDKIQMIDASTLKKDGPYILTKYTVLSDVGENSPRAAALLAEYGLHCVSCFAATFDTLETGARVHGMEDSELDEMIAEINDQLYTEYIKGKKSG